MKNGFRYWLNLSIFGASALIVALGLTLLGLSYQGVQAYIHPVRSLPDDTPAHYGIPFEDVALETADGLRLSGWYTPPQNGAVILVAHGHSSHRWTAMHVFFAEAGLVCFLGIFEHMGLAKEIYQPLDTTNIGYYEALDVAAALDFALNQEGVSHLGAWGGSMGGTAIIMAAARRPEIEAIVADSAYAAIEDELKIIVRLPWMRPLVRSLLEWETSLQAEMVKPEDQIHKISPRPVFIIQGLADGVIATDSAVRLFAAAGEPRLLWIEPGVAHLGMRTAHPDEYRQRVIEFFDRNLLDQ